MYYLFFVEKNNPLVKSQMFRRLDYELFKEHIETLHLHAPENWTVKSNLHWSNPELSRALREKTEHVNVVVFTHSIDAKVGSNSRKIQAFVH